MDHGEYTSMTSIGGIAAGKPSCLAVRPARASTAITTTMTMAILHSTTTAPSRINSSMQLHIGYLCYHIQVCSGSSSPQTDRAPFGLASHNKRHSATSGSCDPHCKGETRQNITNMATRQANKPVLPQYQYH